MKKVYFFVLKLLSFPVSSDNQLLHEIILVLLSSVVYMSRKNVQLTTFKYLWVKSGLFIIKFYDTNVKEFLQDANDLCF